MSRFLLFLFACLILTPAFSQKRKSKRDVPLVLGGKMPAKRSSNMKEPYWRLYRKDTKGILYGNKCFLEATRKMGFEYRVLFKGQYGYMNGYKRFWRNFATKLGLFVKAGPLWPFRLRKWKKRCREATADFYG